MNGDEEIKKLLREDVEISRESLKILRGIRRNHRIAATFRVLYWFVLVAVALGAYYYIQPYVDKLPGVFSQVQNIQDIFKNIPIR